MFNKYMRLLILTLMILLSQSTLAKDCSKVPSFKSIGTQTVHVSVRHSYWKSGNTHDEKICSGDLIIPAFDVRARENEAYHCLKPKASEVLTCKTHLDREPAEISVVPASWIRTWNPKDNREYRFHSYIVKTSKPKFFIDVFSRSLSPLLASQELTLEGALKTGLANPQDGYHVRVEFKK